MKKILVVDDEKEIRELLKERLTQSRYSVIVASSGQEALEICKVERPNLILLDIAMSVIDGYETCKRLREDKDTKGIPVIFLTGKELEPKSIIDRCDVLSACGHVSKLSTLKELIEKVKKFIV